MDKELEIKNKINKRNFKHGMTYSPIYNICSTMKQRCSNSKSQSYEYYGGRGIKVCKKWLNFLNFYKDMGERPEGRSLDRIDNSKGYCKENCRWATKEEQSNNKRNNRFITYRNKKKTVSQWSEELKISPQCLSYRLNVGWNNKKVLTK